MKNIIILFVFSFFLLSCNKVTSIFKNSTEDCIYNFHISCNDSITAHSVFKGEIGTQPVCIYTGDGEFEFEIATISRFFSDPGEWVNPNSDSTLKNSEIGLILRFNQKEYSEYPVYFGLQTPYYKSQTPYIDIINDISKYEYLPIGDDNNEIPSGYTFGWLIPCGEYDLSPIQFSTGLVWGIDYYYDQHGKWIKVVDFNKERVSDKWIYDITFDINVNIFTRRGYYGEVKGMFKTHFIL